MIYRNLDDFDFEIYSDYAVIKKNGEIIFKVEKTFEDMTSFLDFIFKELTKLKNKNKK